MLNRSKLVRASMSVVLTMIVLVASSCGKNEIESQDVAGGSPSPQQPGPQQPGQQPQNPVNPPSASCEISKAVSGITAFAGAAPWSMVPNSSHWTRAVMNVLDRKLPLFEKAQDKELFCPGYASASKCQKEICWLRLVGAVSKFESDFKPTDAFREPSGAWSVGLLALSPGECSNAPTVETLKDPVRNLICGVEKMASLINSAGYIDGPESNRGASAYWSTLRAPYEQHGYKLGKKDQILPITRVFKRFE